MYNITLQTWFLIVGFSAVGGSIVTLLIEHRATWFEHFNIDVIGTLKSDWKELQGK